MSTEYKYGLSELFKKDALKTKIKKTTMSRLWKKIFSGYCVQRLGFVMSRENLFRTQLVYRSMQIVTLLSLIVTVAVISLNAMISLKTMYTLKG